MKRAAIIFPIVFAALAACGSSETPTPTPALTQTPAPRVVLPGAITTLHLQIFEELHTAIQEGYVYADYGGVNWETQASVVRDELRVGMNPEVYYTSLRDLVAMLPDGSSSYMSRSERIANELEDTTVYEGIGAFVAVRAEPVPRIVILSVINGSPAEDAGLMPHDVIFAIDGEPVREEEGLNVVERVRGPAESKVILEVVSPGEASRPVTVVRRQLVAADPTRVRQLPSGAIHVLVPVIADQGLIDAMGAALREFSEEADPAGIILDLRIAHSAADWPLAEMLTLLTDGELGAYFNRETLAPLNVEGQDLLNSQSIPIVLLVGPDTHGVPEVFASALQASGRAQIIGMDTPGLVLGYDRLTLQDGSQLIFASSSYETLPGNDLSRSGLTPDLAILADWDVVTLDDDPVLKAAERLLLDLQ